VQIVFTTLPATSAGTRMLSVVRGSEDWLSKARTCSGREEDRGAQARGHWARKPVSDRVPIPYSPVPMPTGQCQGRSGVRRKASTGHGAGASRERIHPRVKVGTASQTVTGAAMETFLRAWWTYEFNS
jgi:hypothetical protein